MHPRCGFGTTLTGINKYNSIVGWYLDSAEVSHGFKRYSNGSFVNFDYPGAQYTLVTGTNDSGTIVGWSADNVGVYGFIYHNGQWAQLNYGTTKTTQVYGISNANVIVGVSTSNEPSTSFLYENGTFKVISYPNSFSTQVAGISANGMITGNIILNNNDPNPAGADSRPLASSDLPQLLRMPAISFRWSRFLWTMTLIAGSVNAGALSA